MRMLLTEDEHRRFYEEEAPEEGGRFGAPLAGGGFLGVSEPSRSVRGRYVPPVEPRGPLTTADVEEDLFLSPYERARREELRARMEAAYGKNPDAFAQNMRKAEIAGLPHDIVDDPRIQQEADRIIAEKSLGPQLETLGEKGRRWIMRDGNLELAQDDIETVRSIERVADTFGPLHERVIRDDSSQWGLLDEIGKSYMAGYTFVNASMYEGRRLLREAGQMDVALDPTDVLLAATGTEDKYRENLFALSERFHYDAPKDMNFFEKALVGGAGLFGQIAARHQSAMPTQLLYAGIGAAIASRMGVSPASAAKLGAAGGTAVSLTPMVLGGMMGHMKRFTDMWGSEMHASVLEYAAFRDTGGNPLPWESILSAAHLASLPSSVFQYMQLELLMQPLPKLWKPFVDTTSRAAVLGLMREPAKQALTTYLGKGALGVAGEVANEMASALTRSAGGRFLKALSSREFDPVPFAEDAKRALEEGEGAFYSFLVPQLLGMGGGISEYLTQYGGVRNAQAALDAIAKGSADSKLLKRAPQAYRNMVTEIVKDGPKETTYVDIKAFNTYFQSQGIDPKEAAGEMGVLEGYEAAMGNLAEQDELVEMAREEGIDRAEVDAVAPYGDSTNPVEDYAGIDLEIPTGVYAEKVAGSGHHAGLAADVKFDPEGLTPRQAEEHKGRIADWLVEQTRRFAERQGYLLEVEEVFREKLSGVWTDEGLRADAAKLYALASLQAEAAGAIPSALEDAKGIVFQRDADGKIAARSMGQPVNDGVDIESYATGVVLQVDPFEKDINEYRKRENRNRLADMIAGKYENRETGWSIALSRTNVSHSVSSAWTNRDIPFEKSMMILRGLPRLIENARLVESHEDRHGAESVVTVHRMYVPVKLRNDMESIYKVKLTVKEMDDRFEATVEGIYRAHDAKVIEKVPDAKHRDTLETEPSNGNTPDTFDVILGSFLDGVKDSDGKFYLHPDGQGQSLYQFAGPKALTADPLALSKAQEMAEQGASSDEIKQETGWFRGMDGKWRFEIDDSKASFNPEIAQNGLTVVGALKGFKVSFGREATLGDILVHEDLYRAYPELRDAVVKYAPGETSSYYPRTGEIHIAGGMLDLSDDDATMRRFLHEIQHAIQEKEDFARGGSPAMMEKTQDELRARLHFLESTPEYDAAKKELDGIWRSYIDDSISYDQAESAEEKVKSASDVFKEIESVVARLRKLGDDSRKAYLNLAGEIEARDTAERRKLNAKGRTMVDPDRDPNAIVVWGGTEMAYRPEDERNIVSGSLAMEKVIENHEDFLDAMFREDVGSISFFWGEPGKGPKLKGGSGVAHLIARRNSEGADGEAVARKMVETIARGVVVREEGPKGGERITVSHGGYSAVLSLYRFGNRSTWLLTGWENSGEGKETSPGVNEEVYDSSKTTLSEPTRFQSEEVAGDIVENILPPKGRDGKPLFQSARDTDADYLAAVEAGDMETAQRLTDEAAKAAGYARAAVHTTDKEFTAFDKKKATDRAGRSIGFGLGKGKFYFTHGHDSQTATSEKPRKIPAYLKIENPIDQAEYEAIVARHGGVESIFDLPPGKERDAAFAKADREIKRMGYDGIVGGLNEANAGKPDALGQIAVFEPSQIKSADAVTRDESGNVIPLSRRFDAGTEDIRYQGEQSARRAAYTVTAEGERIVTLFKAADASSLIHEFLGHHIIERYLDAERAGTLTEGAAEDMRILREWTGAEGELTEAQKENIARAWEAYVMEGKAPSPQVEGVFARFKAALLEIYRTLRALSVEMTDEVRGVFDRMLIAEDELRDVKDLQGYDDALRLAAEAGVDAESVGLLAETLVRADMDARKSMTEALVRPVVERVQNTLGDRRRQLRDEMTKVVRAQPVYALRLALRRPGGKLKLSRQEIVDTLGEEALADFRGMYSVEGGTLALDSAVNDFGFDSIHEMRAQLRDAPDIRKAVKEAVSKQLDKELQGGMFGPALAEIAQLAAHSETRLEALVLERLILDAKTTRQEMTRAAARRAKVLREYAANLIQGYRARSLSAKKFFSSEARFQLRYEKAVMDGNLEAAMRYKDLQGLQFALGMESLEMAKRLRRAERDIGKYAKRGKKTLGLPLEILDGIDMILESVDLKPRSKGEREVIAEMQQWVDDQRAKGEDPMLPENVMETLDKKAYTDMTVGEIRTLHDSLKSLEHMGKMEKTLLSAQYAQDYDETVVKLVGAASPIGRPALGQTINQDALDRTNAILREILYVHMKVDFIINILDGGTDGAYRRAIWDPLNDATDAEQVMLDDAAKTLRTILTKHHTREEVSKWRKRRLDTHGAFDHTFTKENLMALALNWGNPTNRDRVQSGYNTTPEQVEVLFDEYMEERDWAMVRDIWTYIDTFWPAIEQLHADMTGIRPEKVKAAPVTTQYGTFDGGYYPIAYDKRLSHAAFFRAQKEEDLLSGHYYKAQTSHGHAEQRMKSVGSDFKLELHLTPVLGYHVQRVIHDLVFRKALRDVNKLLTDENVAAAITSAIGAEGYRQFRPWIEAIAGVQKPALTIWEKIVKRARSGATVVTLGLRASPAISQLFGYTSSAAYVGTAKMASYMADFMAHPTKWMERARFVRDNSAFMRYREQNFDQDVRKLVTRLIEGNTWDMAQEAAFRHIGMLDAFVTVPTWYGVYHDAIKEGKSARDARRAADTAVRQTQNVGRVIDTAAIQRGGPLQTMYTMFYSYMNVLFNMTAIKAMNTRSLKDIPGAASFAMLAVVLPAVMQSLMRGGGPDDEEPELFDWLKWAGGESLGYAGSTVIGLRDIISSLSGFTYQFTPAEAPFEQVGRFVKSLSGMDAEDSSTLMRAGKAGWQVAEYWWGIPSKQIRQSAGYLLDLWTGEEEEFELRKLLFGNYRK